MSLIKSIGGKNVNFDFNKEFLSIFSDKIKTSDIKFINQTLKDLHPSDVANLIENLSSETRAKLIEIEEFDIDPEIFVEINESIQTEILQLLSSDSIAKIIKRLESDNAISIIENLKQELSKLKSDSGMVKLEGEDITNFPTRNIVLKGISRAFQISNILPYSTWKS